MIKAPRNNMASAPRWRTEAVPAHEHDWVTVGTDGQGETYRQCSICDARSCVQRPRYEAQRADWLEYKEEWSDSDAAPAAVAAPEVVEEDDEEDDEAPVKRGPGRPRKY